MSLLFGLILLVLPLDTTTLLLDEVVVVERKGTETADRQQQSRQVTTLSTAELAVLPPVISPKDIAQEVPNLAMPDYGSAMTSSIYVRGLGARLDQPVVGIMVDGIPLLDKNGYDRALLSLTQATFYSGPQGTLYGRNTMGGIMALTTRLPLDVACRETMVEVGYGSANTFRVKASYYHPVNNQFGWSLAATYGRTDGFYTNTFTGKKVDDSQDGALRLQLQAKPTSLWSLYNVAEASYTHQGAFPYADALTGQIAFNSPSGYRRFCLQESLRALYEREDGRLQLVGTYQLLADHMFMDQDYTSLSYFTLNQKQRQHAAMVDAFWTGQPDVTWYRYSVGATAFIKHNQMDAPVSFLRTGIDSLILANANRGIHKAFPNDSLEIEEEQIEMSNRFLLFNAGGAVYHQSEFSPLPRLHITAGIRLDCEYASMDYDAAAPLHYRMTAMMTRYRAFQTALSGSLHQTNFQVLPRLDIRYDWDRITLYGYAARGSKAGGYNPQIFSTILQNRMMTDLMADMGVHLNTGADPRFTQPSITQYKPESAWTGEVGIHALLFGHDNHRLTMDADVFYTDVQDQQVTVFPEGKTTGRMMANAAHARSAGTEGVLNYRWTHSRWQVRCSAAYGFTDARFLQFDNGMGDYSGKVVPYAPRHTFSVRATMSYRFNKYSESSVANQLTPSSLSVTLAANGQGRTYWNEANTLYDPFYAVLHATCNLMWQHFSLHVWAKNLTNTSYQTFYFVSMSRPFYQQAKPVQAGVTLRYRF